MPVKLSRADSMALGKLDGIELPAAADMHVHLREGAMTDLVVYDLRLTDIGIKR